ncbi:hypothetical protein MMA231_00931 [Asticcacaulis sp. MM231]|uniref:DUF4352 domain-containing protein n=1 Tax=Asticcacaulis sp. MM231 TaxID=3157666 RepID=UPI0032D57131
MTDNILRLTTLKGHSVVIDGTKAPMKVVVTTDTGTHNFTLVAVRNSPELGDYLEALPNSSIQISADDAAKVKALLASAPKKKSAMPFILGGIGVLVVLAAIGAMSPSTTPDAQQAVSNVPAADTAPVIGKTAITKNVEVTVTKALIRETVGGDNQYLQESAAEGGVLVVVEYKIKNISAKPIKSFEQPRLKLIDEAGTEYNPDSGKSASYASEVDLNRKMMSDLNPDISVLDADVFEVSKTKFNPATWYAVTEDGTKISLQ